MKLNTQQLHELCSLATSAAKLAGEIIESYLKKDVKTNSKEGGESYASQVVTEVDLKCQDVILDILSPSLQMYDLALLTEENADDGSRLEKDYFWCIDPLDGTLPFIEKKSGFAVSIALVDKKGKPHIGVVFDPLTTTLYYAIKGGGAYKNGVLWQVETPSNQSTKTLTFICDRSFKTHKAYPSVLRGLKSISTEIGCTDVSLIQHGGAVKNAIWVLENAPACYFKFPKNKKGGGSLWDYAATACIFNELGAVCCDMYGKPLDLNRPYSTFLNHRGILFASNQVIEKHIKHLFDNLQSS